MFPRGRGRAADLRTEPTPASRPDGASRDPRAVGHARGSSGWLRPPARRGLGADREAGPGALGAGTARPQGRPAGPASPVPRPQGVGGQRECLPRKRHQSPGAAQCAAHMGVCEGLAARTCCSLCGFFFPASRPKGGGPGGHPGRAAFGRRCQGPPGPGSARGGAWKAGAAGTAPRPGPQGRRGRVGHQLADSRSLLALFLESTFSCWLMCPSTPAELPGLSTLLRTKGRLHIYSVTVARAKVRQ